MVISTRQGTGGNCEYNGKLIYGFNYLDCCCNHCSYSNKSEFDNKLFLYKEDEDFD